jgi:hypothetical protein
LSAALAAGREAELAGLASERLGRLLNQAGVYLNSRAQCVEAEPLYRRALAIAEKALGRDHPNTKTCAENLALFLAERKASGK